MKSSSAVSSAYSISRFSLVGLSADPVATPVTLELDIEELCQVFGEPLRQRVLSRSVIVALELPQLSFPFGPLCLVRGTDVAHECVDVTTSFTPRGPEHRYCVFLWVVVVRHHAGYVQAHGVEHPYAFGWEVPIDVGCPGHEI